MCRQYSELTYDKQPDSDLESNTDNEDDIIVHAALFDGDKVEEKLFPHMVRATDTSCMAV